MVRLVSLFALSHQTGISSVGRGDGSDLSVEVSLGRDNVVYKADLAEVVFLKNYVGSKMDYRRSLSERPRTTAP